MSAPARASPRQPRPVAREGMVDITQRGLSLAQPKGGAAAQRRVELSPAPARTRVVRTGATTPAKRGTASKRHRERSWHRRSHRSPGRLPAHQTMVGTPVWPAIGHGLLLLVQHLELPQQHGPQLGWLQARLELLVDEGLRAAVGV